ncbi:Hypothetical protein NocV09_01501530 [Nannochloropsis oceanica]
MKETIHYATLWALPAIVASLLLLNFMDMALMGVHSLAVHTRSLPGHDLAVRLNNLLEKLLGGKQIPFTITSVILGAVLVAMISCSISLNRLVILKSEEVELLREEGLKRK